MEEVPVQKERKVSSALKTLKKDVEKIDAIEDKLRFIIDYMRSVLSQDQKPMLKEFWDAKNFCMELFKEKVNPIKRKALWKDYKELTSEASRLKEILDEQSLFAIEQIEIALKAIEGDQNDFEEHVKKIPSLEFSSHSHTVISNKQSYDTLQREIHFLNTLITRLNALRKGTIETDMRIRHKNRLLSEMSNLGDCLFPRRKELVAQISDAFYSDVMRLLEERFPNEKVADDVPSHILRSEIKILQSLGKQLTLTTKIFAQSRKRLNLFWDALQEQEKEKRADFESKKGLFDENFQKVSEDIKSYAELSQKADQNSEMLLQKGEELLKEISSTELLRDKERQLKSEVQQIRKEIVSKIKGKKKAEQEKEEGELQRFGEMLTELKTRAETFELEKMEETKNELMRQFEALSFSSLEALTFERLFTEVDDLILDKRIEKGPLIHEFLHDKEAMRERVKAEFKTFRKESGKSGLDFTQAMVYRDLVDDCREHLERLETSIDTLEQQLEEIEE